MKFLRELWKTVVMLFQHPKKLVIVLFWVAVAVLAVVFFSWLWETTCYRLDLFSVDGTDMEKPWGYDFIFR